MVLRAVMPLAVMCPSLQQRLLSVDCTPKSGDEQAAALAQMWGSMASLPSSAPDSHSAMCSAVPGSSAACQPAPCSLGAAGVLRALHQVLPAQR